MKEIILSEFKPTDKQPFAIFFVYPKDGEPIVVKGMCDEVKNFVNSSFPNAIYRYTFWNDGVSRGSWSFAKSSESSRYICTATDKLGNYKRGYDIRIYKDRKLVKTLYLRRIPHKWIPEYDV
jgi:hypothetical protein